MNDEERELLKYLAGSLGVISQALADGAGIYELQQINQGIQRDLGDRWATVFGSDRSVSIAARVNPDGSLQLW